MDLAAITIKNYYLSIYTISQRLVVLVHQVLSALPALLELFPLILRTVKAVSIRSRWSP